MSFQTPVEIGSEQKKVVLNEAERKRPLIAGKNTYDDVVVNPAKLMSAEMCALTFKNAASCLLNKVVDLIFTKAELVSTKGVMSLDQHRILAIKDQCH